MRILRGIVYLLGLILIIVGISQPLLPKFWLRISQAIASSDSQLRIFGIVAVIFGVVLILASIKRAVALIPFVLALGIIALGFGVVMLVSPGSIGELMDVVFLKRPQSRQHELLWVAGGIRVIFGIMLILSVTKARPLPEQ
jgi:uncharacterized protein YjeT (DUF2065 family)